jgi:hypothetical protein
MMTKGRSPSWACGPFLLSLLLPGCGESTKPTAQQREQLENAAEMLDLAADELESIDTDGLGEPQGNSTQPER